MPIPYSNHNVSNSVAALFAQKLIAENFLVYWHLRDTMQTQDGMYFEYSVNRTTYLADNTFNSRYTSAKAIVTVTDSISAETKFLVRPTTDSSYGPSEIAVLPAAALDLGNAIPLQFLELGSNLQLRYRHLVVEAFLRSKSELAAFADYLAVWFDEGSSITINNHEAGTLVPVGDVTLKDVSIDSAVWLDEPEERRYQVILNARLEYVA